jgi:hypothetical protein
MPITASGPFFSASIRTSLPPVLGKALAPLAEAPPMIKAEIRLAANFASA